MKYFIRILRISLAALILPYSACSRVVDTSSSSQDSSAITTSGHLRVPDQFMPKPEKKIFWRNFKRIMLFILIAVVVFDVISIAVHKYNWKKYYSERQPAIDAGYDKEYEVCSRKDNVVLDGVEYLHFHAFRAAILDGSYIEDLLVRCDSEYLDKAPNQKEGLILFGKKESYYDDQGGISYTIIDLYSVCDCSTNDEATLFGFGNVILVTFIGILLEVVFLFIFASHKLAELIKRKMKNKADT